MTKRLAACILAGAVIAVAADLLVWGAASLAGLANHFGVALAAGVGAFIGAQASSLLVRTRWAQGDDHVR